MSIRLWILIPLVVVLCSCNDKGETPSPDAETLIEGRADESDLKRAVPFAMSVDWTLDLGGEPISFRQVGTCVEQTPGDELCDLEEIIILEQGSKSFVSQRIVKGIDIDQVVFHEEVRGAIEIVNFDSEDTESLEVRALISKFHKMRTSLPENAVRKNIHEVADLSLYRQYLAYHHYFSTNRCREAKAMQELRRTCPVDQGNIFIANGTVSLAEVMAYGEFTQYIEVDIYTGAMLGLPYEINEQIGSIRKNNYRRNGHSADFAFKPTDALSGAKNLRIPYQYSPALSYCDIEYSWDELPGTSNNRYRPVYDSKIDAEMSTRFDKSFPDINPFASYRAPGYLFDPESLSYEIPMSFDQFTNKRLYQEGACSHVF